MSMLDAFFNKAAFNGTKCKTLLKLTIPRIKLMRNRREIQLKKMRRDIAKLLEGGKEATARIRVEHIIIEENMMAAQEILELFCELILARLPVIETQRECPLDLKEAISSLCFAAPRCADLPELQQVQMLFATKYGKEFVAVATELMPNCGVNQKIIELLSVRAPSDEVKIKLLKEISAEHEVEWDPAYSKTENLKPFEDFLNGPNYLITNDTPGLSREDHDALTSPSPVDNLHERPDFDREDTLDLPEVPKASVNPSLTTASPPDVASGEQTATPIDMGSEKELIKTTTFDGIPPNSALETADGSSSSGVSADHSILTVSARRSEQFVPFGVSPPSSAEFLTRQCDTTSPSEASPSVAVGQSPSPTTISAKQSEETSSAPEPVDLHPRSASEVSDDLQDVLFAVHSAAETAERAAAAAHYAASLAQARIAELVTKMNGESGEKKNRCPASDLHQTDMVKGSSTGEEHTFSHSVLFAEVPGSVEAELPSYVGGHESAHQSQHSTFKDDTYSSYPNLFSRQD